MGKCGRRGFTLIELLVVIAIMGAMVTAGVVSLNASRGATRVFAAARDVMSMIRRARAVALVMQKPAVVVYSNEMVDDEPFAAVELQAMKLFTGKLSSAPTRTLDGEIVDAGDDRASEDSADENEFTGGDTLEDSLSPQRVPEEVVRGIKIKVVKIDDRVMVPENESKASKISIFSTADSVSRVFSVADRVKEEKDESLDEIDNGPVKVVFTENGMVNPPHRIWLYEDGSEPERGICIEVDRFGEPTCKQVE